MIICLSALKSILFLFQIYSLVFEMDLHQQLSRFVFRLSASPGVATDLSFVLKLPASYTKQVLALWISKVQVVT